MEDDEIRKIRGKEIAMIFQEPMTSLNPVFTVGYQITESIMLHLGKSRREADEYAAELLNSVGIPDAARRLHSYPHELSGGMRQRAMIAMALVDVAVDPDRGRADDRAGRHHPGADTGPPPEAAGRAEDVAASS